MTDNIGQAISELSDPVVSRYVDFSIIKEMTPAELLDVPAPTQVSNRTIYNRCLAWGCTVVKTNGNWVWMSSPFEVRFKVRPPQQHEANSKFDVQKMLDAMILPWSVFIGAEILNKSKLREIGEDFKKKSGGIDPSPADEMGPCEFCEEGVIRALMVKRGKKIAHSYCAKQAAEAKHEPKPGPVVTPIEEETEPVAEPTPETIRATMEPEPQPEKVEVASLPRGRYINSVFDLLVERGDPMSNRAVGEALKITASQAGSSLAQLANLGVVTRVKSGVYQAKPGLMRKDGTLGLVISGGLEQEPPRVIGVVPPNYSPVPHERPETVFRQEWIDEARVDPNAEEDEILNELLDLMAPNGFKARHLPYIDAFKSCAVALMREINDGE